MKSKKATLLIAVENQVRELDAKLLLACVAARQGLPSIIGSKRELESHIASFPRSIYLAKSLVHGNSEFLRIARMLGHENVEKITPSCGVSIPKDLLERQFMSRAIPAVICCGRKCTVSTTGRSKRYAGPMGISSLLTLISLG
jgi:surface carbohydrate biosynthesis protein